MGAVRSGAAERPSPPDAIYFHGNVVTVDAAIGTQQAFAVRGDRFVAVGTDAAVLKLASRSTRRIDLKGATVIPGLADSHDHLWNAAKVVYDGVDLAGVSDRDEMFKRIAAGVAVAQPGEVVFTTVGWSARPVPTRADLDRISATVPILLVGSRRGQAFVNTAALRKLGISRENPYFRGTRMPVDASGEPTGAAPFYPVGVRFIDALLPALDNARVDRLMQRAMRDRNALGITSVRDLALFPEAVAGLQRLRREGKLTLRIAMGREFPDVPDQAANVAGQSPLKFDDPWLFVDSISEEPWPPATTTPEAYTLEARAANRAGWRLAPHVNSDSVLGGTADAAAAATLGAFEAADRDSPLAGKRWYMEHMYFATAEQMERMARLGVTVSVQDNGYYPLPPPLPPERMAHQNPIRGFLDHKLVVIAGSDFGGANAYEREPNNPLINFHFYTTRRTQDGAINSPSEKISREEALHILTANHAYAVFQENQKGRIAPGLLADFVVLNQDLMTVPDEKLLDTHPLATYVGGKQVYAAPAAGSP